MWYIGEITSLAIFVVIVGAGFTGLYLLVRSRHRRWKWQDEVNRNSLRRELMNELDIAYEVDAEGFVKPIIRRSR